MRVTCGNCQAGYTVPDDKLSGGRRLQFSCRHCGERVVVGAVARGAAQPGTAQPRTAQPRTAQPRTAQPRTAQPNQTTSSPGPAAQPGLRPSTLRRRASAGAIVPTAAAQQPRWFVANPDGSYQKLAESELRNLIDAGALAAETLIWRKGFGEWAPAGQTEPWTALFQRRGPGAPKTLSSLDSPAVAPRAETRASSDHNDAAGQPATRSAAVDAARAQPVAQPIQRRRRPTDRGSPAPHADALQGEANHADRPETQGSSEDIQTGRDADVRHAQQAVSLPIVRPKRATSAPQSRHERPSPAEEVGRFSPQAARRGTPMDLSAETDEDEDAAVWAPATDTYIGPRGGRFTRRLGSGAQRDALLAQVDRETQLRRELRRWQWVALGSACAAILAFCLAVFSLVQQRSVDPVCVEASGDASRGANGGTGGGAAASAVLRGDIKGAKSTQTD